MEVGGARGAEGADFEAEGFAADCEVVLVGACVLVVEVELHCILVWNNWVGPVLAFFDASGRVVGSPARFFSDLAFVLS